MVRKRHNSWWKFSQRHQVWRLLKDTTEGWWMYIGYPGGGGLNKFLYGEVPPRGPTPYPFIYHSWQKKYPISYKWYHILQLILASSERCIPFNYCKYTVFREVASFSTSCRPCWLVFWHILKIACMTSAQWPHQHFELLSFLAHPNNV